MKNIAIALMIFAFGVTVSAQKKNPGMPNAAELSRMAARFAPTPLRVDISRLEPGDKKAVVKIVEAARVLDVIFMKQYWSGDLALHERLQKDKSTLGKARLHYFWINKSPWSDLDDYRPFIPGMPARKPEGANFYPEAMKKAEFESWLSTLPQKEQEQAKGFFTVIRRDSDGRLKAVPYSDEYKAELMRGSKLLKEAADLTPNVTLKRFLISRADAFLSNDYYESDLAWMDLDAPVDLTMGPYQTYNDELYGYKAAFEAYVNIRDDEESAKLAAFSSHLQELEDNLPIDPKYRNPKLGAAAPIRVVDQILASGDGAHGITTAAYNLPNDERVVQQKGSKRVMLRNVQQAKFGKVLVPIATRMLPKSEQADVKFDPFFTHTVAHELMHGLGPHQIKVQGRETTPRDELKELYSAIEEAKADVTGLFALQYMMDHAKGMGLEKILPAGPAAERQLYTTYLASAFRALRFGLNDAHGRGMAVQFNYLLGNGGFTANPDGTFSVNFGRIKQAVHDLDHDLLTLEAEGDYAATKKLLEEKGVFPPEFKKVLSKLEGIPTDIDPEFVTAEQLVPTGSATLTRTKK